MTRRSAWSAICGAVAAGKAAGGYDGFAEAQAVMCGVKSKTYRPIAANKDMYARLYPLYKQLHDAFGTKEYGGKLSNVMKDLLAIKEAANRKGS